MLNSITALPSKRRGRVVRAKLVEATPHAVHIEAILGSE